MSKELSELENLSGVLAEAAAAGREARASWGGRGYGCGRAYVYVGKVRKGSKVAKAIEKEFKFFECAGWGRCIYVGYDNSTGHEIAASEAIADVLKSHGVFASPIAVAD